jgi:thymidylate synthase (FAD)
VKVTLQWATPEIDKQIMYMARVSNPAGQNSENSRLLYYCMEHGHVSPFEMANVCLEIETTRDIGRQILRHRSFSFQEFSQRYADVTQLDFTTRECRIQDPKNRQNSIEVDPMANDQDRHLATWWDGVQNRMLKEAEFLYQAALAKGIAKEQARALLPEGLTGSRMYMNGNIRSWIFYLKQRLDPSTQKEHRELAQEVLGVLRTVAPVTMDAFFKE